MRRPWRSIPISFTSAEVKYAGGLETFIEGRDYTTITLDGTQSCVARELGRIGAEDRAAGALYEWVRMKLAPLCEPAKDQPKEDA